MDQPKPPHERRRYGVGATQYGYASTYGNPAATPEGYGAYGYGGYGGYGETTAQKTFQDYLLILRERVWYIIAAFLTVFVGVVIFTYTRLRVSA